MFLQQLEDISVSGVFVSHVISWMLSRKLILALRGTTSKQFPVNSINFLGSLIRYRLTFASILEEVPVRIRTNALLTSFLTSLTTPSPTSPMGFHLKLARRSFLALSSSALALGTSGLTRHLESMIEVVDTYRTEEGNLAYISRQIAREKSRAENYVAKRKEENLIRVTQGLAPLPEDDVARLFKIPPEPNRLESMLLLGQIDAFAKGLEGTASSGFVKMYAAKASSSV